MSDTITRAELAERWNKSTGTLQNWATQNKGPAAYHLPGKTRQVYYYLADVEAWERENLTTLNDTDRGAHLSVEPLNAALRTANIDHEYLPSRQAEAIKAARQQGFITLATADDIACNVLLMHPYSIWGEEYEAKVWFDMHDLPDEPVAMALVA